MPARRRLPADERRRQVVEAAIDEFAAGGYVGATTEAIARRSGISHAYLFRLYPTKKDIFLAAAQRAFDAVEAAFTEAVVSRDGAVGDGAAGEGATGEGAGRDGAARDGAGPDGAATPQDRLSAMSEAYLALLDDRRALAFQLQLYAASTTDEEIRAVAGERFERLYALVGELSDADAEANLEFMALGMLLNVTNTLGLDLAPKVYRGYPPTN